MPERTLTRRRVMLCNLAPMVRIGLEQVLTEDGVEVLTGEGRASKLVRRAGAERPDVVVLGGESEDYSELSVRLRGATPGSKLILWRRDEDEMHVFDPGADAPRLVAPPVPAALLREVTRVQRTMGEE